MNSKSTHVIEVDTQEGYDQWSLTYDSTGNPLVAIEDRAINELLGDINGKKIIDLGCGTGRNSRKLRNLGAEVTGADFSEGMLGKAKELSRGLGINFIQQDQRRSSRLTTENSTSWFAPWLLSTCANSCLSSKK